MGVRCLALTLVLFILCVFTEEHFCYGQTRFPECSVSDLDALLDLKKGFGDPENRLSSWSGKNCCLWYGIGCNNRTGAVITLDLRNPFPVSSVTSSKFGFWNLSGQIRPSLLKLRALQYLDLSLNTFNDVPIPEFLGSLRSLQYLNLSEAGFSGLIPSSLGNLSSLQYLDVSSGFPSFLSSDDLEWVAGLVSLKHLSMNNVDLSSVEPGWIRFVGNLPFLKELHLSACGLSGSLELISPINLTSLAVVNLGLNAFNAEFPNWLVNITSLVYADLSSSGLIGRIPLGLGDLPNLQYLSLASNKNLSGSCSQLFRKPWKNIEILDFSTNSLHGKLPASLGNIKSLRELHLFSNNIGGGIPGTIGRLCDLEFLDIAGNDLNGSLPEFLKGIEECGSKMLLPRLTRVHLSNNHLTGTLPNWLGQVGNLVELSLDYNLLGGSIPASLGNLRNLTNLGLAGNKLNGSLPHELGRLSNLSVLDVSRNFLSGYVSEVHFSKLSKLEILHLSSNSLIFNVSSNWIPRFQIRNLGLSSCHIDSLFPDWLRSQQDLVYLDLSNSSISGPIPNWFWETISGNLSLLNVSLNQLKGQLPSPFNVAAFADIDFSSNLFEGPVPLPVRQIELLDFSGNNLSGQIPENMSNVMPNLIFLSLSQNRLSGPIPDSIGSFFSLQVMDLSGNRLSGTIPSSIGNLSYLKVLDLADNNLSGSIPDSFGQLLQLQSLHMANNNLTGSFPLFLKNISSLEMLDLANNSLSGKIPRWIGDGFSALKIMSLRSNAFAGEIPSGMSNLTSLQVLDLAKNNLSGTIPASFGGLKAMAMVQEEIEYLFYGRYRGRYYEESLVIYMKSLRQKYTKTLSLVTAIDLSDNNLSGNLPQELTELVGLLVLNLSANSIMGEIPKTISRLRTLSSLDVSENRISGSIPSTLSSLSFLGYLNLSNNNLSGPIPYTGQMTTFGESSFSGNPRLCGDPLPLKCKGADDPSKGQSFQGGEDGGFVDKWFYLSLGLGFATGIVIPTLVLGTRRSWKEAYFDLVNRVVGRFQAK